MKRKRTRVRTALRARGTFGTTVALTTAANDIFVVACVNAVVEGLVVVGVVVVMDEW